MPRTTSNADLVPKEALEELKQLDTQLKTTTANMAALLEPVSKVINELSKSSVTFKMLHKLLAELDKREKQYNDTQKEHIRVLNELDRVNLRIISSQSKEGKELAQARVKLQQYTQENKVAAREVLAAANSIEAMRAKVAALKQEWKRADVGSERFKQLEAEIGQLTAGLSQYEQKIGVYSRNVGNYASAFSPLQFQVQQVARELPSLTVSASQFFLAISNNLPMLADELARARKEFKNLKAESKDAVPVFKQLLKSIGSWQTLLVVAITVITAYGKEIGQFFKQLFTGKQYTIDFKKAQEELTQSFVTEKQELDNLFSSLNKATKGTSEYEQIKTKIIDQYGDYLQGQRSEIANIENTTAAYQALTQAILENALQKGLSNANDQANKQFAKDWNTELETARALFQNKYGDENGDVFFKRFRDELFNNNGQITDWIKEISEDFNQTVKTGGGIGIAPIEQETNLLLDVVSRVSKSYKSYNAAIEQNNALFKVSGTQTKNVSNATEELAAAREKLAQVEIQMTNIRNGQSVTGSAAAELERLENEKSKLESTIETLTGKSQQGTDSQLETQKRISEARLNIARDEADARRELEEQNLEYQAEIYRRMVEDDKLSYDQRLMALRDFEEIQKQLISERGENQIEAMIAQTIADENGINTREEAEKFLADQIIAIRNKVRIDIAEINREIANDSINLAKEENDEKIQLIAGGLKERENKITEEASAERARLAKSYADGLIDAKEYEKEKTRIYIEEQQKRFEAEIAAMKEQLKLMDDELYSDDDRLKLAEKIGNAELEFREWLNEQKIKEDEETAKKQEEIEKKAAEKRKAIIQAVFEFAKELSDAAFESRYNQLDEESEKNQEWADEQRERVENLEESGAISKEQADARKAAIDAKEEEREKQLSRKRAQIQKQQSIFEILLNTASAIMAAWTNPFTAPWVVPVIAAQGAAQLAIAMATPIPEYAQGTDDHPGGPALVGDGGRRELVMLPGGKAFLTPATDTLLDLPKHSVVVPSLQEALQKLDPLPIVNGRVDNKPMVIMDNHESLELSRINNRLLGKLVAGTQKDRANRMYYYKAANAKHTKLRITV